MKIFLKIFLFLPMAIFVLYGCSHIKTLKPPPLQTPSAQKETDENIQIKNQAIIDENDYLDDALKDIDALEDAEIQ